MKSILGYTPRDGIHGKRDIDKVMNYYNCKWVCRNTIGSIEKTHMVEEELPSGTIIVKLSKHVACIKDRVLYDTYDCTRNGDRMVYGFWEVIK